MITTAARMLWVTAFVFGITASHAAEPPAPPPVAAPAPISKGVLSYGEYGRPTTLDPITSNDMIALRITELVFNGLVGIDNKQQIAPELAESWDMPRPDGTVYTFRLRKDVTWHPRAGEAAAAVHRRRRGVHLQDHDAPEDHHPAARCVTSSSTRSKKLDEYTVRFTLKRPIMNALPKFTFKIIPEFGPKNAAYLGARGPVRAEPDRHRAVPLRGNHRCRRDRARGQRQLLQGCAEDRPLRGQAVRRPERDEPGADVRQHRHVGAGEPAQRARDPGRQAPAPAAVQRAQSTRSSATTCATRCSPTRACARRSRSPSTATRCSIRSSTARAR
ncbi:MAG: ABC transporter substrate-binding protein [Chromatiales bacterium]|nr:ABC transporter substrate-binding protein [Chromatiales bacterium]